MDEREKIISIIRPIIKEQYLMRCKEPDGCDNCWIPCSVNERAKALADALIAANIGDVTEWKERTEKAENTLKEWVKCIFPLQSAGFTINPIDVLRDSTKCITIAQRALENIIKQYWCDNRGCSECEEKQGCIEEICSRYIQQAEREIEGEKND